MHRSLYRGGAVLALVVLSAAVLAQTARPERQPTPSIAAPGPSQTPQLPAGSDTGIPGEGQKPAFTGNLKGDNTPRKVLQRRAEGRAASAPAIDDRAAARLAGRGSAPAASAAAATAASAAR
jgi:hypothetical protein